MGSTYFPQGISKMSFGIALSGIAKRVKDEPVRCDVCGRFVGIDDFMSGAATRVLLYPDTEFTTETFETLCRDHKDS